MPKRLWSALPIVVFLLAAAAVQAASYKLDKTPAAPDAVPAALKEKVAAQGVRVLGDGGAPYAEIWLHKALPAQAQPAGADILYTGIPEGSFLGVWRFAGQGADVRGQRLKPGFYTMRYALMPADGNHMGAAQFRDFVLLVPVEADSNLAANLKFEEAMALSRKASGTGHPAVFPLVTPDSSNQAALAQDDHGNWILKTSVATKSGAALPIAITVFGKAE